PIPTFSTCFGAPFMPRRPEVYGNLLRQKIAETGANCWLVNTGWTGGPKGHGGSRMPIRATRSLVAAALSGGLADREFRVDPNFGFEVPVAVKGVAKVLLDPRRTWEYCDEYDVQAAKLANMFADNFTQYEAFVDDEVLAAAIKAQ
ncbi:MAG: phosphoenolpyruvate carboxykinase (ATP), partial [Paracoccaceae bacterium]